MKKIIIPALLLGVLAPGHSFGAVGSLCLPIGKSCSSCTSYKCDSGYYGTATSASSGCTKCPLNATCAGGNNSTFVCDKGYYNNGTGCTRCPASGGIYGTTANTGATAITECYIPSGSAFSDSTGNGTYTDNCYYTN